VLVTGCPNKSSEDLQYDPIEEKMCRELACVKVKLSRNHQLHEAAAEAGLVSSHLLVVSHLTVHQLGKLVLGPPSPTRRNLVHVHQQTEYSHLRRQESWMHIVGHLFVDQFKSYDATPLVVGA
jgi:hypothetical protein